MDLHANASSDAVLDGQPTGDLKRTEGQDVEEMETSGEPTDVEGLDEEETTSEEQFSIDDYKALQREFGSRNEELKSLREQTAAFEQYGGLEQIQEWISYLQDNPRFAEFMKQEQSRQHDDHLGLNGEDLDDDTRRALELVRKEAEYIADQRIKEAMKSQVDPIANQYKERMLEENINAMDNKYGDDWREVQDTMAELAKQLPLEVQDAPSLDTLEDLYWKALRVSGKMDSFAAKSYEKKLAAKKAKSTDRPSTNAGKSAFRKPMSIQEAYEQAKAMQS